MKYKHLLWLVLVFGCMQIKSKPITEFSQKDINDAILLDVRTPEEYSQGHIDNALNVNFFDSNFVQQMERLEKDQKVYVYCKKGGRSAKAAHLLDSLGFKKVIDLTGGYDAFKAK